MVNDNLIMHPYYSIVFAETVRELMENPPETFGHSGSWDTITFPEDGYEKPPKELFEERFKQNYRNEGFRILREERNKLLNETDWGELDYLIVDMPPGTGDIQLTMSQKVPASGTVIVTTPQDISLLDDRKALKMFEKVNVPIIGIVENMAVHLCSNCGHEDHIFGSGGGEKVAADYNTQLLGSMPLDRSIRERGDSGLPSVAAEPDSDIAQRYGSVARQVIEQLAALDNNSGPEIVFD